MPGRNLSTCFDRPFRMLFDIGAVAGLSDGELLGRFAGRQGEGAELAFAALLERHGPMVFRVCLEVLGDRHDALDAFQATFLVLVRRVQSVRKAESIASWLHGVALRVASCHRVAEARRRKHERRSAGESWRADGESTSIDLGPILHGELDRLPERYRMPLVLCHLEGMTHEQAAERLGWPIGTVKSRMARGRERLKGRLARRGIEPPSFRKPERGQGLAPPSIVMDATARAAAKLAAGEPIGGMVPSPALALMQGVLKTMTYQKIKLGLAAVTLLGIVAATAGVLAQQPAPVPPPTQAAGGEVSYEARFTEMTGFGWREEFHQKLKPIARKGATTVWAVDADTLQAILGKTKQVVQAPRVTAFKDATAVIDQQNQKNKLIVGFKDLDGDPSGRPQGGVPKMDYANLKALVPDLKVEPNGANATEGPARSLEIDEVSDGLKVSMAGHRVTGGVLVRLQVESRQVVSIAQLRVPERVVDGDMILSGKFPMMVPEMIEARVEGEWVVPSDGALIIGLGVHRFPTKWSHEIRERLVVLKAGDVLPLPIKEAQKVRPSPDLRNPKAN